MMTWLSVALVLGILWTLAYLRATIGAWVLVLGAALGALSFHPAMLPLATAGLWSLYAVVAAILGIPPLRRRLLAAPLLKQFSKVIPRMSDTEREALEAGSVGWDAELFSGRPDWPALLATPAAQLSDEERAYIDGPVEELCRRLDDWRITHQDHDLSPEVWRFIKQQRFFGLIIPREYGGLDFSALAHSTIVMKLASRSISAAVSVMVPNSLGPAKLLLQYGTEAQKAHYLPRLARGEEVPCFALTGPEAGSDASAIPDRGVICRGAFEGREVLGIRLNWDKRYITLGPIATLLGLAFRLYDPDHLLGDREDIGITLALIPTDTPGVTIGRRHVPLDIAFQNGPNQGRDVFIPLDWIIGGREHAGQGWRMLMECLADGRAISLPALATGAGKTASRYTGAYARIRRQFRQPIGGFEGVEEALARIAGKTYQMEAARMMTAGALDAGEKPSVISAMIKYHLTERYRQVINDAMDIQGGSGICLGPSNLLGRPYQAIPIAITVEGANILTRSMIIFGQGAIRCHPYVLREFRAAQNPHRDEAVRAFDAAIFGHVGFLLRNLARSLFLGLSRGRLAPAPAPATGPTAVYFRQLNWMSAAFALCADVAMLTLGGTLKRRERLSARLGDVLSNLYLASAALKRFEDQGRPGADLPLVSWACEDSLFQIQESLRALLRNLPLRPVAWLLRAAVFPTGLPYRGPGDHLDHQAARLLLAPSPARERLTADIFVAEDEREPSARLERALAEIVAVEAIETRLRQARRQKRIGGDTADETIAQALAANIIDADEARQLRQAEALRRAVIQVDAFDGYGTNRTAGRPWHAALFKTRLESTSTPQRRGDVERNLA